MPKAFFAGQDDPLFIFPRYDDRASKSEAKDLEHSPFHDANDIISSDNGLFLHQDVIVLDSFSFAKGGGKGGGGTGGGGHGNGGGTDPNVLSSYTSGDSGGYNIDIKFKGTWTSDLQQAFIDAAEKLSDIITSDVGDVFFRGKTIDDIQIDASLTTIDDVGGILGQAGPTAVRTDSYLPATAVMEFDSADASALLGAGLWDEVILHEMIHSVGFGSIWDLLGLISGSGTSEPLFTGANAIAAYEQLYGVTGAAGVPLEQDGGAGTRESHWDEETFDGELMTGYLNASGNFLSDMTIASLEDLGYETTFVA